MSRRTEDICNSVCYILEPHAPFISKGEGDETRYFVPHEVLEVLSWIAVHIVLPVFVGGATSKISDMLKKKETTPTVLIALDLQQAELEEVRQLIAQQKTAVTPNEENIHMAKTELARVLQLNGFPTDIAEGDADRVVTSVLGQLS